MPDRRGRTWSPSSTSPAFDEHRMRPDPAGSSCDPWQTVLRPLQPDALRVRRARSACPSYTAAEWARVTTSATSRTSTKTIGQNHGPRADKPRDAACGGPTATHSVEERATLGTRDLRRIAALMSSTMQRVCHLAIVSAYNQGNLDAVHVVGELRRARGRVDVLVVNNGSTDDTAARASADQHADHQPPRSVPRHQRRRPNRLPGPRSSAATLSPYRSTATASTILPTSTRSCATCARTPTRHGVTDRIYPRRRRRGMWIASVPRRTWASASSPRSSPRSSVSA